MTQRWNSADRLTRIVAIVASGDFVILVVGTEDQQKEQISSAYRMYEDVRHSVAELARDALRAFQYFLERASACRMSHSGSLDPGPFSR